MAKVSSSTSASSPVDSESVDPNNTAAWEQAQQQAKDAGILWERPSDDKRSAQDIIDDSPLLKNLGNQSGVRDSLEQRVGGDIETDADAAFRAVQVLEHIEKFDGDGNRLAGKDVDNGEINGFTGGGDAKNGTEAGRLQDFGKYGFETLKGEMDNADAVGDDDNARADAEKAGIKWELPEDDERSAQDIIEDNPVLKNLGNQSGIKDMLKEQVGDYEKDANAAYRASQVIDRVVMYDEEGKALSGEEVSNTSIDGFTKDNEARHGTEAGRLQDFGKTGYSALSSPGTSEEIGSYKEFLEKNKNADEASKTFVKYAAILGENYDAIKGKVGQDGKLTADDLKRYMDENPQIGDDLKEALNFWSKPGAFSQLETAADPLKFKPDGKVSSDDISNWIKNEAPKDANSAVNFLSGVASSNAVGDVDVSKLDKDILENPDKHSTEEKAAALQELLAAQQLVMKGAEAGMWGDDYGKVAISNRARTHPDPKEILQDLNGQISVLENDPEVVKFLNENVSKQMSTLLEDNPSLKDALEKNYEDIKSGDALDKLWDTHTKDGKTDQQAALAEFYTSAGLHQEMLGIKDTAEIQKAVASSEHAQDFKDFYEKSLASGDRLEELMKDNSFEEAVSAYTAEVALYNGALDPEFTAKFDQQINDNFTKVAQENAFKDGTFDDLKAAFGVDGGDELDEAKVKSMVDEIIKTNPELVTNPDGSVAPADKIVAGIRGNWDLLRQGTKSLSELKSDWLNPDMKNLSDKGVLHGVSGLLMAGVTIAKGAQSGGNLNDKAKVDIATGSVQTVTLLTEGGVKNYKSYLKTVAEKHPDSALGKKIGKMSDTQLSEYMSKVGKVENIAKGVGGIAGIVTGAYSIFDGVQAIRRGDDVTGGINITAGSIGALAGVASAVEGGVGAFGSAALRAVMAPVAGVAGVLGMAAAGVGAIAMFLPGLIAEGKQQTKQDNFGELLGSYLTKYEIDGVPNGDIYDVPEDAWPDSE